MQLSAISTAFLALLSRAICAPAGVSSALDTLPNAPVSAQCISTGTTSTCGILVNNSQKTVLTTTSGSSTWEATYVATSLSQFSTVSSPTTITTTDTAGETIVAVILAAGAAWLAVPKAGAPLPNPPGEPPAVTNPPTVTTTEPSSTSSTTSSTTSIVTKQPDMVSLVTRDWQSILRVPLVMYDSNKLTCGWSGVPDVPTIDREVASSKIKDFCAAKNQTVVNETIPTTEYFNVGAGVVLNITVSQYPLCRDRSGDESMIYPEDCDFFLHEALDSCDTNSNAKRGGRVSNACLIWNLQPEYNAGELTCGTLPPDGTGFDRQEAMDNIQDFCQKISGSISTPSISNSQTFKPKLGNSNMNINVTYSSADQCPQDSSSYKIDRNACQRFLYRALDDCNTKYTGYLGKAGGSVTDDCGIFSFSTEVSEVIRCGGDPYPNPVDMTPAAMDAGIFDYCNMSLSLDPNYKSDGGFHQDVPEGESYDNFVQDYLVVRTRTQFSDQAQTGCAASREFNTMGDECRRRLNAVKQKCGNGGGGLTSNTVDGCVLWTIWGSSFS